MKHPAQEKWPGIAALVVAMDCCCVHTKNVHFAFIICNKWTENATSALALPHQTGASRWGSEIQEAQLGGPDPDSEEWAVVHA